MDTDNDLGPYLNTVRAAVDAKKAEFQRRTGGGSVDAVVNALAVVLLNRHTATYLHDYDRKAFEQALHALGLDPAAVGKPRAL